MSIEDHANQLYTTDPASLSVRDIVENTQIVRVRYFMPDTSAFVRYLPRFDEDPEDLQVNVDPHTARHISAEVTGTFRLPELVNDLEFAYILMHIFPSRHTRDYYIAGFDGTLSQLEFIGGAYDFNRLWLSRGTSNLGVPTAIFLGQRSAVNGQPAVVLMDHRRQPAGERAYRAVRGAGQHVGEDFYVKD